MLGFKLGWRDYSGLNELGCVYPATGDLGRLGGTGGCAIVPAGDCGSCGWSELSQGPPSQLLGCTIVLLVVELLF